MDGRDQLPPLRDVIARFDLGAKKSLGQHFLLDQNLTDKIARAAGNKAGNLSEFNIIEVGPGPGGLTRSLLAHDPKHLFAVERDRRCIEALEGLSQVFAEKFTIVSADAMKTDIASLGEKPRRIVANLPYNISTALLINWLRQIEHIDQMTLMFQKEVVDRLIAKPSTKAYGRLSVITQWLCETKFEFNVDKRAFTPPPKIQSSVLTLRPRTKPLYAAKFEDMEKVTATAFGQRRKMLRSSLKPLDIDISTLGIDPTARAENLTIEEFCLLAKAIEGRD
ncbi:MAG: 16S rRNA (adenine(1518)-N(6)/adenine(1519)-N(6))-dimethyltransferase RsmA [Rhodospirillaceae bacterium]|nr:16S rRNA (adenine(1518)-N(6)/adenine(1519)-N(6))-dimethyltransferase RsmA [Rhodospirillaceae bacterium]MBT5941712.1 16S rRNA (adenine(1518)-N(6)/adenine(1519)-N(6))-dimethyltransferase RsmA [Rhodospirillaceae bacterium]MBT7267239.1 16S rRNA (adenine(1518)-N(6)/adenine(1519)-N(6))-dimethyltransferase RsmA [Rhodospirillaceae bacterium]